MSHRIFIGITTGAMLSVAALTIAPAQAVVPDSSALPDASLSPDEFAADLGFDSLKNLTFSEPSDTLGEIKTLITGERNAVSSSFLAQYELDASKLFWNGVDPVEVYFMNEGAGYRNQLFYSASDLDGNLTGGGMIFNDIASRDSILPENNGPLMLGQGVSLGGFSGSTQLDFSILSNGYNLARPGENATAQEIQQYENKVSRRTLGTDMAQNSDGLQHVVAFQQDEWVILGFEDIVGGGDLDYNDVVFAVRGIQEGVPEDVPEPSAMVGMVLLGIGGVTTLRRKQRPAA
jgi:hypothetical protein